MESAFYVLESKFPDESEWMRNMDDEHESLTEAQRSLAWHRQTLNKSKWRIVKLTVTVLED